MSVFETCSAQQKVKILPLCSTVLGERRLYSPKWHVCCHAAKSNGPAKERLTRWLSSCSVLKSSLGVVTRNQHI